jgi:replicative DNA helicase
MVKYADRLSEFGKSFQVKVIYSLIHDIKFLQDIYDIIDSSFFEREDHKWIVDKVIEYYNEYKACITMDVLAYHVKDIESLSFAQSVKNAIKEIYTTDKLDDIEYTKDQFENFCKNQKLKQAIIASTELLKRGEYDEIKDLVDDALKAGMSKDFGHNWIDHVEARLSNVRNTSPTHMEAIDNITNGGLSGGEIGVIAAPSGIGKCVGKNTEIEIQYDQIGFQISEQCILWFDPWDKIKISNEQVCYAWEIELLFDITGFGKTS